MIPMFKEENHIENTSAFLNQRREKPKQRAENAGLRNYKAQASTNNPKKQQIKTPTNPNHTLT